MLIRSGKFFGALAIISLPQTQKYILLGKGGMGRGKISSLS